MSDHRPVPPRSELPVRFRRKVVLYATWRGQLLVFLEPDFPDVPLQVPGGTVEDNEPVEAAARREFFEETGLEIASPPRLLGTTLYSFDRDGIHHRHERFFFHWELEGAYPERWEWVEKTPDGGGAPIRFSLFWTPLDPGVPGLFGGLDAFLSKLLSPAQADGAPA